MANKLNYRQYSIKNWISPSDDPAPTIEEINTGSLQRIADAATAMAENHTILINKNERLKQCNEELRQKNYYLWRSNYALRGHITRLKKKIQNYIEFTGTILK